MGHHAFRAALAVAALAILPASSSTATPPITTSLTCATYSDVRMCSGEVPSFDGSALDVDVTLPAAGTGSSHPLMLMFHGFGNDKREWESTTDDGDVADKWHWNRHRFAKHRSYVLTSTARR